MDPFTRPQIDHDVSETPPRQPTLWARRNWNPATASASPLRPPCPTQRLCDRCSSALPKRPLHCAMGLLLSWTTPLDSNFSLSLSISIVPPCVCSISCVAPRQPLALPAPARSCCGTHAMQRSGAVAESETQGARCGGGKRRSLVKLMRTQLGWGKLEAGHPRHEAHARPTRDAHVLHPEVWVRRNRGDVPHGSYAAHSVSGSNLTEDTHVPCGTRVPRKRHLTEAGV